MVFVIGACFGSFFNVCIYRVPRRLSLISPPSHCYQCGEPLKWRDNVPLLSYWIRRGRCRYCGAAFTMRYFAVELLTASLFAGVFVRYCEPLEGCSWVILPGWVLVSLLIISTFTDLDHWIIPDRTSLGGALAGLTLAAIPPIGSAAGNPLNRPLPALELPAAALPPLNALAGGLFGFGLLWLVGAAGTLIFRKEAMGRGDMKLMAMMGTFIGPLHCVFALMIASVLGSLIGSAQLLWDRLTPPPSARPAVAGLQPDPSRLERLLQARELGREERLALMRALSSPGPMGPVRHHLPFGPSLAAAGVIVYMYWEPIRRWLSMVVLGPYG